MRRLPPTSTRTDTPFPYTTRVRSRSKAAKARGMTDFTDEELALDPNFADRFEQGFRPACQLFLISPPAIGAAVADRSEAHTSELESLMRNSSAVYCLKKIKPTWEHASVAVYMTAHHEYTNTR